MEMIGIYVVIGIASYFGVTFFFMAEDLNSQVSTLRAAVTCNEQSILALKKEIDGGKREA